MISQEWTRKERASIRLVRDAIIHRLETEWYYFNERVAWVFGKPWNISEVSALRDAFASSEPYTHPRVAPPST